MPGYSIPPWIGQPADPAAHFAQGYQIGAHVGAQQAAHLFQQQQLAQQQQRIAMQQQQQEYENQMQAQVLNLKASEAARQHQAAAAYQARVASGEDPSRVLMDMAPMLGESAGSVLHDQRMRDQTAALQNYRLQNMQRLIGSSQSRQMLDAARLTETARHNRAMESRTKTATPKLTPLQQADKSVLTARLRKLSDQEAQDYSDFMANKDDESRKKLSDTWKAIYDTRAALERMGAPVTTQPNVTAASVKTAAEPNVEAETGGEVPSGDVDTQSGENTPTDQTQPVRRLVWTGPGQFEPVQDESGDGESDSGGDE